MHSQLPFHLLLEVFLSTFLGSGIAFFLVSCLPLPNSSTIHPLALGVMVVIPPLAMTCVVHLSIVYYHHLRGTPHNAIIQD